MKNVLFYELNQMCQLAINASCIVHISHSQVLFQTMNVQNTHSDWSNYLQSKSVYYTRPITVVVENTNKSGFKKKTKSFNKTGMIPFRK